MVGADPEAAACVALGIGAAQAPLRRVAIGDLVGDLPALQRLLVGDDPHGISDSFLYGVSLNRIAHAIDETASLFVMPSGTEPVAVTEILGHERWYRLAAGFRSEDALLLLVARSDAPGLENLVAATDGAVLVGGGAPRNIMGRIVASASLRGGRAATEHGRAPGATTDVSSLAGAHAAPADGDARDPDALNPSDWSTTGSIGALSGASGRGRTREVDAIEESPVQRGQGERRARPRSGPVYQHWLVPAGSVLLAAVIAFAWAMLRNPSPRDGRSEFASVPTEGDTVATAAPVVDSAAAGLGAPVTGVTNPADSALAVAYGVQIANMNTKSGAILRLQSDAAGLPAATFAPVVLHDGNAWFRVVVGAAMERPGADSLLQRLRSSRVLEGGAVVRTPFALMLQDEITPANAPALVSGYTAQGIPAYALLQPGGSARIYAGAFETPEQAALLASSLRAEGISSVVVYRTGRAF